MPKYLFAEDVLGTNTGHYPRHSKRHRDFAAEHRRLQGERIRSLPRPERCAGRDLSGIRARSFNCRRAPGLLGGFARPKRPLNGGLTKGADFVADPGADLADEIEQLAHRPE